MSEHILPGEETANHPASDDQMELFQYPSAFVPGESGQVSNIVDFGQLQPLIDSRAIRTRTHPDPAVPYRIYQYARIHSQRKADTPEDPILDACRGLIVNTQTGLVVARPFQRMRELGEHEELPDGPNIKHRKIDGTLGIQYATPDGQMHISTRSQFDSVQAQWGTEQLRQYEGQYGFDPDITYLWEMVVPEGDYTVREDVGMTLLGRIATATGTDLGLPEEATPFPVLEPLEGPTFESAASMRQADLPDFEGMVVRMTETGEYIKVHAGSYRWLTMERNEELPGYVREKILEGKSGGSMIGRVPTSVKPLIRRHVQAIEAEIDTAMEPIQAKLRGEDVELTGRQLEVFHMMKKTGRLAALRMLVQKPPRRQARSLRDARKRGEL